jgi:Rrf2 family cysteine metabolism transcriptional repressor
MVARAMVLSQKSQYAVRAAFELAKRQGSGPVSAARVADAQCIPLRFLENILSELRQAGVVESVRGKDGGYRLSRSPDQLSVGEIIRLVQGPMTAVDCGPACPLRSGCVLLPVWDRAHAAMMEVFEGTTFKELVEQDRAANEREVVNYVI